MMAASGLQRCMRASAGRRCLAHACALPSLPQGTAMNEHVAWRASLPALPWSAGQLVGRKHSSWALLGRNGTPLGADAQSSWVLRAKKGKKGKKGGRSASAAADDEDLDPEEALTAVLEGAETAMDKAVKWLTGEMAKLRGAGASPNMLDHITVDAYGSPAELSTIAQVSVKGATMLQVSVFDPSLAQAVADAIAKDDAQSLNPSVDGMVVKVPIPKTTKETKAAVAKVAGQHAEKAKTTVRNARKAALDQLKKVKSVSEDDVFRYQKQVQDVTDASVERITELHKQKVEELS